MQNDGQHSNVVLIDANTHRPVAKLMLDTLALVAYQVDGTGKPTGKPDMIDVSSPTVIYEGYKVSFELYLCKILIAGTVTTRTWGIDTWANRATATYA